jgi:hypothetical protein
VTDEEIDLNGIGLCICEAEGILDVLAFIHLEAEPDQLLRLNDAMLTLLYLTKERLRKASQKLDSQAAAA